MVIDSIKRVAGVAGQVSYVAQVTDDDGDKRGATFVGSVYGGPVVMVMPSGFQTFVTDPGRFGKFGREWVRRFFAAEV